MDPKQLYRAIKHVPSQQSVKDILALLCSTIGCDFAYLAFLNNRKISSVDFFCTDPRITMPITISSDTGAFKPGIHDKPFVSFIGRHTLSGGMSMVLKYQDTQFAIIEVGNFACSNEYATKEHIKEAKDIIDCFTGIFYSVNELNKLKSQQKKVSVEFDRLQEMQSFLIEDSNDVVMTLNPDGSIIYINGSGCDLLHLRKGQIIPLLNPGWDFIKDRFAAHLVINDIELIFQTGDRERYFIANLKSELDFSGNLKTVTCVAKDITDRILSEKKMWKANLVLAEMNEKIKQSQSQMVQQEKMASIGNLAAGIAHEINNPLGFVFSNENMLVKYVGKLEECISKTSFTEMDFVLKYIAEIKDILDENRDGIERISHIIKSLKNLSRVDHQGKCSTININQLISSALVISKNEYKYVADVETELADQLEIECYPELIGQVLLNLIVNASQAIAELDGKRHGLIKVKAFKENSFVIIEITDNGPGIPENIKNQITNPFFTTKEIGKGTGLGLSISQDIIVNKHKGKFYIASEKGKGASFTIMLPELMHIDADEMESV